VVWRVDSDVLIPASPPRSPWTPAPPAFSALHPARTCAAARARAVPRGGTRCCDRPCNSRSDYVAAARQPARRPVL